MRDIPADGGNVGNVTSDHVESAHHDGKKVVEVVRNAARKLTDGFHLLRLPERFFGPEAGLVFHLQFAGPLSDRLFQSFSESTQLGSGAFAFGNIDADADDANWHSGCVVDGEPSCVNRAQGAVVLANDAEFTIRIRAPLLQTPWP